MAARKSSAKQTTKKAAKATAKAPRKSRKTAKKAEVSVDAVNLGHIFALRPRVTTAFPQDAFHKAKDELRDERFGSLEEAARAVAHKALETSQKKPGKHGIGRR